MNNQYLASEIILAKNSAATATAKATSLLIDVYNLQLKDVKIDKQINDISLQLQKINLVIESSNIVLDQSSNTQLDLSFQNLLQQFNQLSTTISGELINFNTKITDFSNNIFLINNKNNLIEQSFNLINTSLVDLSKNIYNYVDDSIINNKTNDNTNIINFLSNQELLLKSDIQFQNTLIRDNDIDIHDIKVELNRLNHKLNRLLQHLNIDINLI